jgi:hypothetical protein
MEETEEKIISIVLEEGKVCALTDKGRIFIQTPFNDKKGNYNWREIKLPDLQMKLNQ